MTLSDSLWLAMAAALVALVAGYATWVRRRRSRDAQRAVLKGFHYILSDEPDAALEELTRAADVDARTVETYFALGALFRRTGEHERAIRLHQNMLLRPELEPALRQKIQLELALDFQRAGTLERAVATLREVLEADPGHLDALLRLRQIYEDRKDYAHAADAQRRIVQSGEGSRSILAHLLAEAALGEADPELAGGFAARAVEADPDSAHAALARGLAELKAGRTTSAAEALQRACRLDPELAPHAAEGLQQALPGPEAAGFFEQLAGAQDHPALRLALARCQRSAGAVEAATANLRRAIEQDPRWAEARVELGRALLDSGMGEAARREMQGLLDALEQSEPAFSCQDCGHASSDLQFRCVRCLSWDTVRRVGR